MRSLTSAEHPEHPVPDKVAASLQKFREEELATLARQHKIERLARPNEEERQLIREIQELEAQARGVNTENLRKLRDLKTSRSHRLMDEVSATDVSEETVSHWSQHHATLLQPVDHSFWWAETSWFFAANFTANWLDDGLHFTGKITHDSGDLLHASFGALALFELQSNRIPPSASG